MWFASGETLVPIGSSGIQFSVKSILEKLELSKIAIFTGLDTLDFEFW